MVINRSKFSRQHMFDPIQDPVVRGSQPHQCHICSYYVLQMKTKKLIFLQHCFYNPPQVTTGITISREVMSCTRHIFKNQHTLNVLFKQFFCYRPFSCMEDKLIVEQLQSRNKETAMSAIFCGSSAAACDWSIQPAPFYDWLKSGSYCREANCFIVVFGESVLSL